MLSSLWLPLCLAYISREERERKHPELFRFPYMGRGDPDHSFRQPYEPSAGGDPIHGWFQVGTTMVTRDRTGRDVVRLTSASQANQGLLYNAIQTESQNFNGYFDVQMTTVRDSHEPADGMGFFFVRDRPSLGSAMGIDHTFQGLGIIIDTFSNSRTRNVPYLYGYVSDGSREWNPDTDGADTQLTKGCALEMNHQIRVYVRFLDGDLHVGVAMNPRTPHRWHTCFKVSNVRLPFNGGGHLAFAAETGHFFALHEVHSAAFIDESPHSGEGYRSDYVPQDYGAGTYNQQQVNMDNTNSQRTVSNQQSASSEKKPETPAHQTNPNPASRIHRGADAASSLAGSIDLQVYEVYNSMSSMLKNLGDSESQDTKLRLDGVRDVTTHLIREMDKQKTELGDLISVLRHLKQTAGDLTYASDRFSSQVQGLHNSLRTLREKTNSMSDSHDDMHEHLLDHHESITEQKSTGFGTIFVFLLVQGLLGTGVYFVNKMALASRKMGRMV